MMFDQFIRQSLRRPVNSVNGMTLRLSEKMWPMETVGKRIKEARKVEGISRSQLARMAGIPYSTLAEIENERTKETARIAVIASALGWNALYLSEGKGLKKPDVVLVNATLGEQVRQSIKLATEDITIPQFDTGGRMGNGLVLKDQPGIIEEWRVSREWLNLNIRGASSPGNLCIVTGFGDSMAPLFRPGDPLIVDLGVREVLYDAVYFFRVEDEGFIKRLQRIPGQGLLAISENKSYRDWTITDDMNFEVFGRVLKAWAGHEL